MRRDEILKKAAELIDGDRAADYGDAGENFDRIRAGWAAILGRPVSRVEVALCMDWLKTARLVEKPDHQDSWIDKAGYTALGGELAVDKPDD